MSLWNVTHIWIIEEIVRLPRNNGCDNRGWSHPCDVSSARFGEEKEIRMPRNSAEIRQGSLLYLGEADDLTHVCSREKTTKGGKSLLGHLWNRKSHTNPQWSTGSLSRFHTTDPGSIPGLSKVDPAFHSYCSESINEYQAYEET
ncbi:hypothetical protein TNCV_2022801 [Trichonephila clavipes]|nr:hypothetical protein TNCV_2022801 [Trichonephila clavipes]